MQLKLSSWRMFWFLDMQNFSCLCCHESLVPGTTTFQRNFIKLRKKFMSRNEVLVWRIHSWFSKIFGFMNLCCSKKLPLLLESLWFLVFECFHSNSWKNTESFCHIWFVLFLKQVFLFYIFMQFPGKMLWLQKVLNPSDLWSVEHQAWNLAVKAPVKRWLRRSRLILAVALEQHEMPWLWSFLWRHIVKWNKENIGAYLKYLQVQYKRIGTPDKMKLKEGYF